MVDELTNKRKAAKLKQSEYALVKLEVDYLIDQLELLEDIKLDCIINSLRTASIYLDSKK